MKVWAKANGKEGLPMADLVIPSESDTSNIINAPDYRNETYNVTILTYFENCPNTISRTFGMLPLLHARIL